MKTAQVVAVVLAMSLDDLSVIQVVANDRIAQLQANGQELVKTKNEAEQVALGFASEIRQLMPAKVGRKPKHDSAILEYVQKHPGCSSKDIYNKIGLDQSQFSSVTKRLRERNLLRAEGNRAGLIWYVV